MKTRVMSVILAALLILALIPSTAFAEEPAAGSPEPTVQTPAPDTEAPDADTETPDPDAGAPDADTKTPDPDAGTPDPDTEAPDPDAGTPAPDENDEPKIPAPKTGLETPKAGLVTTASGAEDLMTTNGMFDRHNLTVNVTGQGTVSGWKKVLGIFVSTDVMGTNKFFENTEIKLQANEAFGWEFSNWTGDISGSDKTKTLTMSGPKNVTAVFTQRPLYTVTFVDWDDAVLNTQSVYRGYDATPPTNPTRAGYRFTGWDGSYDNIQTDGLVLKAQYVEQCTLSVHKVGEGSISPGLVEGTYDVGKTINLNKALPIAGWGWSFRGWKDDSTGSILGSSSVTLERGGEVSYTAVFYDSEELHVRAGDHGTLGNNISGGSYERGQTVDLNSSNPTGEAGYEFDKWMEYGLYWTGSGTNTGASITIGDSNWFEAKFKVAQYTISYNLNGGSVSGNPTSYTYFDSAFTLNNPTRTGYVFNGWSGTGIADNTMSVTVPTHSSGNREYTANWTPISYTVNYHANGGIGSMSSSTYQYDNAGALSANSFSMAGCAFSGWAESSDGSVAYADGAAVNNWTAVNGTVYDLYAMWEVSDISVTGYSAPYDGAYHGVTVTGAADIATVTYSTDGINYSSTAPQFKDVTAIGGELVYVKAQIPGAADYNGTARVEITKAELLVKAGNKTVAYGSAAPNYTYNITGFVAGEKRNKVVTGDAVLSCAYNPGDPVGTYNIEFYQSTLDAANYYFRFESGTLTVNKKALTVTAEPKSITYGDTAPAYTYIIEGFIDGENASVLTGEPKIVCAYAQGSPVGSYTLDIRKNTLAADNYKFTLVDGTLTVDKALLTVTANDKLTTYGQVAPPFDVTYGTFVMGQTESVLGGSLSFGCDYGTASSDAGTYDIVPAGLTSDNYEISFIAGELTVDPAALTVTAENKTTVYGSTAPAFSAAYSGFVLGEDAAVLSGSEEYECDYAVGSAVGDYDIMPKGLSSGNYDITFEKGTLTVTPAALTVTADDKTVTFLDDPPAYTVTISGFVAGDDENDLGGAASFDCDYVRGSAVGAYVITPSGLTSGNYNISFADGTLTVTQLILTVRFEDYDGTLLGTDRVSYGGSADAPDDPDREGYNFTGWDRDFDNVRANMTVTATYAIRTFTVTFEDFDGSVLSTDTVDWNTAATPPADPERDGYTFTGWDADFSAVTANMTVTAQYTENALIENEPVPQTGGNGDDDTVVLQDDGVPLQGPAAFPWWWILIGVGVAGLLFLLILFLVRRKKEEQGA